MAAISGDILKGNTLTLILSLLEEQPMYGFQISREVERRSEGTLRFREGLLYPALHQLEKEGLVESEWKVSTQGPRRKYYKLTAKGSRQAGTLRKRWMAFAGAVNQVLGGKAGGVGLPASGGFVVCAPRGPQPAFASGHRGNPAVAVL